MRRSIPALVLLASMLAGCAIPLYPFAVKEDQPRRIVVASMMGESLAVRSWGSFKTTQNMDWPVPGWQVDQYLAEQTVEMLSTQPTITAVAIKAQPVSAKLELGAPVHEDVWAAAKAQGADRLLTIQPQVTDNFRHIRPGYGLAEGSILGDTQRCVYLGARLTYYEVATRRLLTWEMTHPQRCGYKGDNDLPLKGQLADYSAEEQQALQARLRYRSQRALSLALDGIGLVPEPPKKQ